MQQQLPELKNTNLSHESINKPETQVEAEIDKLDDDCLNYIFGFLQIKDKVKIERVCKRWQTVGKNSWQNIKTLNNDENIWGFNPSTKLSPLQLTLIFEKVLRRCKNALTHVDFSYLRVKSKALYHVANQCTNLQSLNAGTLNFSFSVVKAITTNCHNVRDITFTTCSKECDDLHLSKFFSKNKKLRYLKMTGNENLTGKFLESLPKDSMETVIINNCTGLSFDQIVQAISHLENLRALSLINNYSICGGSNNIVNSLTNTITELRIRESLKLPIDLIGTLTNLRILDISHSDVSDTFLTVLAKNCKELFNLDLSDCTQVTDVGMKEISCLRKLEELYIEHLQNITDQSLKYLPKLKKLSCAHCPKIKDDGLCNLIASCDSIEFLNCYNCIQITNNLVDCAIRATKLRKNGIVLTLDVRGTSVESEVIDEKSPFLELLLPSSEDDWSDDDDDEDDDDDYDDDDNDDYLFGWDYYYYRYGN